MVSAAQMLSAIDDAIYALLGKNAPKTVVVDGRTFTSHDLDQLRELRSYYARAVQAERLAAGTARPLMLFGIRPGSAGQPGGTSCD